MVDRTVCTEEIVIALSFHVPYMNAFSFGKDDREWVVVVGTMAVFQFHGLD